MSYRIVIADDDLAVSRPTYERLLDDPIFGKPTYLATLNEFESCNFIKYDALLLDVNLDEWEYTLADAVNNVGDACPVILVSNHWDKEKTEDRIRQVLPLAKDTQFIQVLILNDLTEPGWENRLFAIRSQLRLAVARRRRQATLDKGPNEAIHILHLSDPQYGDAGVDNWACMSEVEIAKIIQKVVPRVDLLAITGDITFDGMPKDFETASLKIGQLLKALFPKEDEYFEKILLVPGNHDVNLRLAAADRISYSFKQNLIVNDENINTHELRRFGLQPFRNFAWNLTKDQRWLEQEDLTWHSDSFRHLGLRFFFLNSVAYLDCNFPSLAKIPEQATEKFSDAALESEELFGVALSHHGKESFVDDDGDSWSNISKIFQTCGVKLWLHGHGHARLVEKLYFGNHCENSSKLGVLQNDEIIRVMAPTTHLKEGTTLRPKGELRGFNIIKIERTMHRVKKVTVTTYRMSDKEAEQLDSKFEINISF